MILEKSQEIETLLVHAKAILTIDNDTNFDLFLEKLETYLHKLEQWQKQTEQQEFPVQGLNSPFAKLLEELHNVHSQVVDCANSRKEALREELSGIYKRAQGMKAYIDRFPSRITIAGKRQG